MSKKDEIKQVLLAEQRVYNDSPNVTVTYKDLARIIEHILILQEDNEIRGFNAKNTQSEH